MQTKILTIIAAMVVSLVVWADTLQLNSDYPQSYLVEKGDTLWDISGTFLTEPWRWPELWEANQQIKNPHLIYPGDRLSLTYKDGRPILGLRRGAFSRNVKLTPQIREYQHDDAIPPIPLDAIAPFLSRPRVVSADELAAAPYVIAAEDEHVITGGDSKVYVRGWKPEHGSRVTVLRSTEVYTDVDGTILGYEALHIGDAIVERGGDPATANVIRANREILAGDRILPQTEERYPEFVPHAPGQPVAGHVISVIDGVSEIGQHQVVVLSKGANDGLEPGHVLSIHRAGAVVRDRIAAKNRQYQAMAIPAGSEEGPGWFTRARLSVDRFFNVQHDLGGEEVELPEERTGELMVFRTFDDVSYGLVMNITRPVHIHDRIRNP